MKIIVNNTNLFNTKEIMNKLLECVKDKKLSVKERNEYYSEYLKLAANYLIQYKNS
jgi:UDP-glucose 6-dehydrogenase